MRDPLYRFKEIWIRDTEYVSRPGERPIPVCEVAREFRTKRTIRLFQDELTSVHPYSIGPESLIVVFFAPAEAGFDLELGRPRPARILDLNVEYRNHWNCLETLVDKKIYKADEPKIKRNSLIGALMQYGLDSIGVSEKEEMRGLINTNGPWTPEQQLEITNYCESDVDGTERLLRAMLPKLDIPRALLRGRYACCSAAVERNGLPIDVPLFTEVRDRWESIQKELIARVDAQYGVYDGTSFNTAKFERWLAGRPWPRYPDGRPILTDLVFRDMAKLYPEINLLRESRRTQSKLRVYKLPIGKDGFNRFPSRPFCTRTRRNAPPSSESILGSSPWARGFIKPPPRYGLADIDWSAQEIGIAAALSGDSVLMAAYQSGDPYLEFAKLAGVVPANATRYTHPHERNLYKQCMLGVGYGLEERSLAIRIGQPLLVARKLLRQHHEIFWRFWEWSDNRVRHATFWGLTYTIFGWRYHVTRDSNPRSIRNFPIQANAAEILCLAVCPAIESGITICATLHDSVFIMAPLERLDTDIAKMRGYMERASEIVLDGFKLRTEFTAVRYPDRYMDEERGRQFWDVVMSLL